MKKVKIPKTETSMVSLRGANEKPTLEELQAMVGGYIEVAFDDNDLGVQVIVDEEGKLKGKPINMEATEHWFELLQGGRLHTLDEFIKNVDYLVGHVVVLHGNARID